jgi:hypothetical protein
MAAPDQGYERVLDELETISATFNTLVNNLKISNIQNYIEKVSTQSNEQMEMLEMSKRIIISLRAQNNALQEENTTLQNENTALTMNQNVTMVIVKDEHGRQGSSNSSAEASPVLTHRRDLDVGNKKHVPGPIQEGSETEDGSETDDDEIEQLLFDTTEGGEGGEGGVSDSIVTFLHPINKQEVGISDDLDPEVEKEEEGVSEGEEEDQHGSRIWRGLPNQIEKIVKYVGANVFLNDEIVEPKFRYGMGGIKGIRLQKSLFENAILVILQAFQNKKLIKFAPGSSTYQNEMKESALWKTYEKITRDYLSSLKSEDINFDWTKQ